MAFEMFDRAGNSTGGVKEESGLLVQAQAPARVDVCTAPRQCFFFFRRLDVVSLLLSFRQKSRRNMSGVVTVWDLGLFDPARCAHLPGHELIKLTA